MAIINYFDENSEHSFLFDPLTDKVISYSVGTIPTSNNLDKICIGKFKTDSETKKFDWMRILYHFDARVTGITCEDFEKLYERIERHEKLVREKDDIHNFANNLILPWIQI